MAASGNGRNPVPGSGAAPHRAPPGRVVASRSSVAPESDGEVKLEREIKTEREQEQKAKNEKEEKLRDYHRLVEEHKARLLGDEELIELIAKKNQLMPAKHNGVDTIETLIESIHSLTDGIYDLKLLESAIEPIKPTFTLNEAIKIVRQDPEHRLIPKPLTHAGGDIDLKDANGSIVAMEWEILLFYHTAYTSIPAILRDNPNYNPVLVANMIQFEIRLKSIKPQLDESTILQLLQLREMYLGITPKFPCSFNPAFSERSKSPLNLDIPQENLKTYITQLVKRYIDVSSEATLREKDAQTKTRAEMAAKIEILEKQNRELEEKLSKEKEKSRTLEFQASQATIRETKSFTEKIELKRQLQTKLDKANALEYTLSQCNLDLRHEKEKTASLSQKLQEMSQRIRADANDIDKFLGDTARVQPASPAISPGGFSRNSSAVREIMHHRQGSVASSPSPGTPVRAPRLNLFRAALDKKAESVSDRRSSAPATFAIPAPRAAAPIHGIPSQFFRPDGSIDPACLPRPSSRPASPQAASAAVPAEDPASVSRLRLGLIP